MFFDQFPEVYDSEVSAAPARLEYRYNLLIKNHEEYIRGKHFIDLGAHDGRFSLAALETGATGVTAVEGRMESCKKIVKLLNKYHPSKFQIINHDLRGGFITIKQPDVVLCAGLLYHVFDPYHILKCIDQMNPKIIIVDSTVVSGQTLVPLLQLCKENEKHVGNTLTKDLVVWPNQPALEMMFDFFNWDYKFIHPDSAPGAVSQYKTKNRVAYLCKKRYIKNGKN